MRIQFTAPNGKSYEFWSDNAGYYLCEGFTSSIDKKTGREIKAAINIKEQTYLRPMLRTIENELFKNTKGISFKELHQEIKQINETLDVVNRSLKISFK